MAGGSKVLNGTSLSGGGSPGGGRRQLDRKEPHKEGLWCTSAHRYRGLQLST
jgi:hypothetical protein